jgi:hypothetical protein
MAGFYAAKQKYFNYLYKKDLDAWFVLDPVITVHPDEVFFECFSQDESTYGRLGASYEVFKNIGEFACGTTNIDYSADLYNEFQKIRRYKKTMFPGRPVGLRGPDHRRGHLQGAEDRPAGLVGARVLAGQLGDDAADRQLRPAPDGRAQPVLRAAPQQGEEAGRAACGTSSSPASRSRWCSSRGTRR